MNLRAQELARAAIVEDADQPRDTCEHGMFPEQCPLCRPPKDDDPL